MKRVLLDCDGVISDFVSGYLDVVLRVTGREFKPEHVTSWNIAEAIGLDKTEQRLVTDALNETEQFAWRLSVLPKAKEGLAWLCQVADVHIVTSPWNSHPTWSHDRVMWLRQFGIRSDHITQTSAKHICVGDILVDDKVSTLIEWSREHPLGVAVKWNTLHNINEAWAGLSTDSWAFLVGLCT